VATVAGARWRAGCASRVGVTLPDAAFGAKRRTCWRGVHLYAATGCPRRRGRRPRPRARAHHRTSR
jgi:hypothetical protein